LAYLPMLFCPRTRLCIEALAIPLLVRAFRTTGSTVPLVMVRPLWVGKVSLTFGALHVIYVYTNIVCDFN